MDKLKKVLDSIPTRYFDPSKTSFKKLFAQKCNFAAEAFYERADYDSASICYLRVIDLLDKNDSAAYVCKVDAWIGLGAVNGRIRQWKRSFDYFDSAAHLALQRSDTSAIIRAVTNKATLLYELHDYASARSVAQRGLDFSRKTKDGTNAGNLSGTIALTYLKEDNPDEALAYSTASLQMAQDRNSANEMIDAYYLLGYNYLRLKQYNKAKGYLFTGLGMARAAGKLDNLANAYGQLAHVYDELGRYDSALVFMARYASLRDTVLGTASAAKVAEIDTRYRVARKDKELAQKSRALLENQLILAKQQKQQYLWIGGAAICILVLLGLLHVKRHRMEVARLKAMIEGEEKERTRLARELHDGIVSRLSIIKMNFTGLPRYHQDQREAEDFRDIVSQLEQGIAELRSTSHNLLPDVLQRAGLAESVRMYCEKITRLPLLDIEFQMVGDLPQLSDTFQLNVYRIIQELVNNIIKHSGATHALILFQATPGYLNITIDDNGNPPETDDEASSGGIGLKNLRDRVRLLDGTMEMERGKGTSVYLEFRIGSRGLKPLSFLRRKFNYFKPRIQNA
jgi:two-component system NarL family sensor kinase